MSSTCPSVPSFGGPRLPPSGTKRPMPGRRAMPKARQNSASAAVPKLAAKEDTLKLKPTLVVSVPPAKSPQREDGPEEGEISDEDDHYSPAEATTPVPLPPVGNSDIQDNHPPRPLTTNTNGNRAEPPSTRERIETLQGLQDLRGLTIDELRKKAPAAVMYLACSVKMKFEDIVAEGVDERVLLKFWDQLRIPYPAPGRPGKISENNASNSASKASSIPPSISVQGPPLNGSQAPEAINNASLPPIPRAANAPGATNPPKPSVVSRFNQSIPGLSLASPSSAPNSAPPTSTPLDVNPMETIPQPIYNNNSSTPATTPRPRKRPVAADFDTEIKTSHLAQKLPRFGNREHHETSQLVIEVSDNEDEDGDGHPRRNGLPSHLAAQQAVPSRPDSANPENNEKLNESIRLKEIEIEELRKKIMARTRKRKIANDEAASSGPPSDVSTPLPTLPSVDVISPKDSTLEQVHKLEQVEQFLHQTLDHIIAENKSDSSEGAVTPSDPADLMEIESDIPESNSATSAEETNGDHIGMHGEVSDLQHLKASGPMLTMEPAASRSVSDKVERLSDEDSIYGRTPSVEPSAIVQPMADSDDDGPGEPMELSSLDSSEDSDDESLSDDSSSSEDSDADIDSANQSDSEESSEDVSMEDQSRTDSPRVASSPAEEELDEDDDGYDPEARETDIGEVPLLANDTKFSQVRPPSNIISQPGEEAVPKKKDDEIAPYRSALTAFKSFRYHPNYSNIVSQGFKSLTYSNRIDPELPVCDFETRGGTCNDPQCKWQHFRQMVLPGAFNVCEKPATTFQESPVNVVAMQTNRRLHWSLDLAILPGHRSYHSSGTLP
ncbi:hypothetical protein ABW19_dt0207716 [Dactylella cylindrospora]|nr:hypothetical protein ABW19_dt0207716 [Dactylella cylindrospora]